MPDFAYALKQQSGSSADSVESLMFDRGYQLRRETPLKNLVELEGSGKVWKCWFRFVYASCPRLTESPSAASFPPIIM